MYEGQLAKMQSQNWSSGGRVGGHIPVCPFSTKSVSWNLWFWLELGTLLTFAFLETELIFLEGVRDHIFLFDLIKRIFTSNFLKLQITGGRHYVQTNRWQNNANICRMLDLQIWMKIIFSSQHLPGVKIWPRLRNNVLKLQRMHGKKEPLFLVVLILSWCMLLNRKQRWRSQNSQSVFLIINQKPCLHKERYQVYR